MDWLNFAGFLGLLGIGVMFFALARISRRLARVTRAGVAYRGLYFAAGLVLGAALARWYITWPGHNAQTLYIWSLVYTGLLAVGVTLGLVAAWHYWSWLFSERG